MEKVRLGDIVNTIQGTQYPVDEQIYIRKEGYERFLRISDYTKTNEPERFVKYTGKELICTEEDVVVVRYGNIGSIGIGKAGILANNLFTLKKKGNKDILSKYIYYFLRTKKINNVLVNKANSSTMPALTHKMIKELEIPIYTKELEIKIVKELDKVQEIIDLRKKQIEELEDLIKSEFVEMFGDPFDNSRWKIKKLGEVAESIYDGTNIPPKYYQSEGKVLFLRIQNVWRNEFRLDDSVYVTEETNKIYMDTSLKNGDLLITKIGRYYTKESSLGRVAIYLGEDNKANYSNNIMRIRVKDEINSKFLNILLNLEDYQLFIRRESKGGTDKRALSKKVIEDFPIIIPPIEMQNQFIKFVKQIDNQKFILEKSLNEIEELQESLMNKYFGE